MSLTLYDSTFAAPNPYVVRLFVLERGSLSLDVKHVDIMAMENRNLAYRRDVNPRAELPALRIGDDFVLTEITAICEYLDEIATAGKSLFGDTALERAETRMWLRRMDLEIAQPIIAWWRNDPETIDFYRGARLPIPEARVIGKVAIHQALNLLDDQLEGKTFLCGDRFSAADILFYGLVKPMSLTPGVEWVLNPGRKNVAAYFARIGERAASKEALEPLKAQKIA
ncbi:glutathione S-transferase domain-containing protein [Paramyrothecium foliicola]|nr:glutathione S-transferase domain-containing protein [Paramyrothecium foliicola]